MNSLGSISSQLPPSILNSQIPLFVRHPLLCIGNKLIIEHNFCLEERCMSLLSGGRSIGGARGAAPPLPILKNTNKNTNKNKKYILKNIFIYFFFFNERGKYYIIGISKMYNLQ